MQQAGVAACAKHFPGHGDTECDSHFELPRLVHHDLERLRAVELVPFAAAIEAGVASVMTGHVSFPAIDGDRPATLSPDVLSILRDELAYDGLVFSDDLEMKAVADTYSPQALTTACLEAGVDSLLVCRDANLRVEVLHQLEQMADAQLEAPLRRMAEFKRRFAGVRPDRSAVTGPPYAAHRALAARLDEATNT
jgi:beta-N-acetylhexosaminidase